MGMYILKNAVTYKEIAPVLLAINDQLVKALGNEKGPDVTIKLLLVIFSDKQDLHRFSDETNEKGPEEVNAMVEKFMNSLGRT